MLAVSFYMFPFMFTFLPSEIFNTKNLMAGFGVVVFVFDSIRKRSMMFSDYTLISLMLASLFSVWCLFSVTRANTYEMDYANYVQSFIIWLAGAYGVCFLLRARYNEVNLELVTRYLALVGVFQCVTAVMVDNFSFAESLVDKIMYQPGDYYKVNHRMYGLGAALDPGGIRFSVIQIMIAHDFAANEKVRNNRPLQALDLIAFAIILIIGSVISRTTLVGSALGIAYMIIGILRMRRGGFVTTKMIQSFFWFFMVLAGIIAFAIYFYRSSETFQEYLRFGFEAFFNWVETGDFHTSSTDILTQEMWIWPSDMETWIVGRGTYGVFENNTDIGYCNFTFYCGLVGVVIFSIFFLYCHFVMNSKFRHFHLVAWLLVALTFIVWFKVTTDIFFIDALLFCIDPDPEIQEAEEEEIAKTSDNQPKLYIR